MKALTEEQKVEIVDREVTVYPTDEGRWTYEGAFGSCPTKRDAQLLKWDHMAAGGRLFRHKKGGVYRFIAEGRHADNGSPVVVYEHLWPHGRGFWVRSKAEFDEPGRFERITS